LITPQIEPDSTSPIARFEKVEGPARLPNRASTSNTTVPPAKMSLQQEISQLTEVLDFMSDANPQVRRIALANLL